MPLLYNRVAAHKLRHPIHSKQKGEADRAPHNTDSSRKRVAPRPKAKVEYIKVKNLDMLPVKSVLENEELFHAVVEEVGYVEQE